MPEEIKINRLGLLLTRKCNFKCIYCSVGIGDDPPDKLTLNELKDLVGQAGKLGAKRLIISGAGEPLLDDNLFALLEYANTQKMSCTLTTNGSLINQEIAHWLFTRKIRVIFKMDSLNPRVQDKLAGKSEAHVWLEHYVKGKKTVIPRGLKYLLDAGYSGEGKRLFKKRLMLETVITNLNIMDIPKLAEFCRGCRLLLYIEKLLPPALSGFDKTLIPSEEQEASLYKKVFPLMDWGSQLNMLSRCGFEKNPLIDTNGNIRFCFSLDRSAGNIRNTSLQQLHTEQLLIKNNAGKQSPRFSFWKRGFRNCLARRVLKQENIWPQEAKK